MRRRLRVKNKLEVALYLDSACIVFYISSTNDFRINEFLKEGFHTEAKTVNDSPFIIGDFLYKQSWIILPSSNSSWWISSFINLFLSEEPFAHELRLLALNGSFERIHRSGKPETRSVKSFGHTRDGAASLKNTLEISRSQSQCPIVLVGNPNFMWKFRYHRLLGSQLFRSACRDIHHEAIQPFHW